MFATSFLAIFPTYLFVKQYRGQSSKAVVENCTCCHGELHGVTPWQREQCRLHKCYMNTCVSSQANCSFYRCSRSYVVPLFSSKKRELLTGDNQGRSSDAFSPFIRHRCLSFECRTTVHLEDRHFAKFVSLNGWSTLEHCVIYNQGLFWGTI